jgi:hypothetical protein
MDAVPAVPNGADVTELHHFGGSHVLRAIVHYVLPLIKHTAWLRHT